MVKQNLKSLKLTFSVSGSSKLTVLSVDEFRLLVLRMDEFVLDLLRLELLIGMPPLVAPLFWPKPNGKPPLLGLDRGVVAPGVGLLVREAGAGPSRTLCSISRVSAVLRAAI